MKNAPTLQIKAAVVQGQAIKPAEVTDLANMPGKPELYARLLSVMLGPATNLVRVLSAVPRDLMSVLAQAEQKRRESSEPSRTLSNGLFKEQSAMAEVNQQQVIDYIKGVSVMELSQLVKALEAELGVSAAAAMPMMGMPMMAGGGAAAPAAEEKTEFTVTLTEIGGNKINVIKVVRQVTSLGLKEAKDLVEGAPQKVKEGVSKAEAETIKKKYEDAGAKVQIKEESRR